MLCLPEIEWPGLPRPEHCLWTVGEAASTVFPDPLSSTRASVGRRPGPQGSLAPGTVVSSGNVGNVEGKSDEKRGA